MIRSDSSDPTTVRLARVALGLIVEPGNRDLGRLVRAVGPVQALAQLSDGSAPGRLAEIVTGRLRSADPYQLADRAMTRADRLGARIITPEDHEYPHSLTDLARLSADVSDPVQRDTYPPQCLWVRGPLQMAEACERSVAIVGARAATAYGEHVSAELAYGLAEHGWTVVSGGAFGIDAAAHRGALAAGGATIAVLACGVDRAYPLSHAAMFERIGETGLLVSEWPPMTDPHRHRFLIRNRVIAALTRGTVMVEASLRSGARFTFGRARDLGRVVAAVPGPVTSAVSAGCHEVLRQEGTLLVAGVEHVLEAVGQIGPDLAPDVRPAPRPRDALTPLQAQVFDGLRRRKVLTAEEIATIVGVSERDARRTLPALVLSGFAAAVGPGYRLAPRPPAPPVRPAAAPAMTGHDPDDPPP